MSLHNDVTFDSLGAVREEIREWLGVKEESLPAAPPKAASASRDMLIAVLIHSLAEEISNVRVRSQIHAVLGELNQSTSPQVGD